MRALRLVVAYGVGVGLVALLAVGAQVMRVEAADPPLFRKGERIAIAWDCLPDWTAQAASHMLAGGQPLSPCYVEALTVQAVREDGWLMVVDDASGTVWRVNPQRAIGFRVLEPTTRAD